jgi:multidrug transporter EmrE-like cation transporter
MYRWDAACYVVYAAASIVTTTVAVGFMIYKEPVNLWHKLSLLAALATVLLFALGQARR